MSGKYYEELEVGQVYKHIVTHTVTDVDNVIFCSLAHAAQPIYMDEEFGKKTKYGGRIVNPIYAIAFVGGILVADLTAGTTLGNLGYESITFPNPVRVGDTLRGESVVIAKRESAKYPNAGIVTFDHIGYNQRNEVVMVSRRLGLQLKKPTA